MNNLLLFFSSMLTLFVYFDLAQVFCFIFQCMPFSIVGGGGGVVRKSIRRYIFRLIVICYWIFSWCLTRFVVAHFALLPFLSFSLFLSIFVSIIIPNVRHTKKKCIKKFKCKIHRNCSIPTESMYISFPIEKPTKKKQQHTTVLCICAVWFIAINKVLCV